MQIIIKQIEIEVAVKNYIAGLGINLNGKDVEVSFTAGRGEVGLSASLDIVEAGSSAMPAPALTPVKNAQEAPTEVKATPPTQKPVQVSRTPVAEPVATTPAPVEAEAAPAPAQAEAEAEAEVVVEVPATEAANKAEAQPAKKVSSLFG